MSPSSLFLPVVALIGIYLYTDIFLIYIIYLYLYIFIKYIYNIIYIDTLLKVKERLVSTLCEKGEQTICLPLTRLR